VWVPSDLKNRNSKENAYVRSFRIACVAATSAAKTAGRSEQQQAAATSSSGAAQRKDRQNGLKQVSTRLAGASLRFIYWRMCTRFQG